MKAIILEPRSSWTLSLRSDTLWGLLLIGIRHVLGERTAAEVAAATRAGRPPFVVSSAMEYVITERGRILSLPLPLVPHLSTPPKTLHDYSIAKESRTTTRLPYSQWCQLIAGQPLQESDRLPPWHNHFADMDMLHIAIDRVRMHALDLPAEDGQTRGQLYLTTERFADNGGLWFLAKGEMTLVEPALRYLAHVGFGTDASVGKGHFSVSIEDIAFPSIEQPTHMVSLSLYHPTQEELSHYQRNANGSTWYEIEFRRGKCSPQFGPAGRYQKQPVAYFREGSVFPYLERPYYGRACTVGHASDHALIAAGFGLMIPARFSEVP